MTINDKIKKAKDNYRILLEENPIIGSYLLFTDIYLIDKSDELVKELYKEN